MSAETRDLLWLLALVAGGVDVLVVGWLLVYTICDAERLCPLWVRALPARSRAVSAAVVETSRALLMWAAVSLLLIATPHTPETTR